MRVSERTERKEIVVLHADQTRLNMDKLIHDRAIEAAFRVTMSPHEWEWSGIEQAAMAAYVLWAHQRLSAVGQLTRDMELNHQ